MTTEAMRGRAGEWTAVLDLLGAAEAGRSGVLLVDGEPGAGKSLLLAEAARAATARGFRTAIGAAPELGTPGEPLRSALGAAYGASGARPITHGAPIGAGELRSALESPAGPVLVCLDDLQWADPAALAALATLPWPLANAVGWLLARRTGEGGRRLFDALGHAGTPRLPLVPLGEAAIAEVAVDLLGAAPGPDLAASAAETGGNPFLLAELLGGLRDEGALVIQDGRAGLASPSVPERARAAVRRLLDPLSPAARRLLTVAATLGDAFAPEDAAEMLGTTPAALLPPLDEAIAAGLLTATADRMAFRHGLVRRIVGEDVPSPVRRALHRQIGEQLIARGGEASAAAHHLLAVGDVRALDGIDRAIAQLLPWSPGTAADLSVRALDLTGPADPAWAARALTAAGVLTAAGRRAEAGDVADSALERPMPAVACARMRCLRSGILRLDGRAADAAAAAAAVLAEPGLPGELRDEAELALLNAELAAGDRPGARRHAESVLAAEPGDVLATGALIVLALVIWGSGDLTGALDHAREAAHRAGSAGARHLRARTVLAMLLADVRLLGEARTALAGAGEETVAPGHLAWAVDPGAVGAGMHLAEGRLQDALTGAEAAAPSAPALALLAAAALRAGDLPAAGRYVATEASDDGAPYARARLAFVDAQVTAARSGARAVAGALGRFREEPAWTLTGDPAAAAWLTRAAISLGDRRLAEDATAAADRLARANPGLRAVAVAALHARGLLQRDPAMLEQAAEEHPDPWARASAAEDLGALAPAGRVRALDRALAGYTAVGAARDAARVRRRLRRLGVRRRHWTQANRPASGWASLTDTERTVSALVAQGLTNRQIADQLFMSVHTVAFHLRHIYRKLNIGSRVELTRLTLERDSRGRR